MKKKVFLGVYLIVTSILCFFLFDPYLRVYVQDEGLKFATMSMFWVYCFCNPYIVMGVLGLL